MERTLSWLTWLDDHDGSVTAIATVILTMLTAYYAHATRVMTLRQARLAPHPVVRARLRRSLGATYVELENFGLGDAYELETWIVLEDRALRRLIRDVPRETGRQIRISSRAEPHARIFLQYLDRVGDNVAQTFTFDEQEEPFAVRPSRPRAAPRAALDPSAKRARRRIDPTWADVSVFAPRNRRGEGPVSEPGIEYKLRDGPPSVR